MGMNLGVKSQAFNPSENQEWLGSHEGTQSQDSITLDGAALMALFPTGIVPSGVLLAKKTSNGKYTRYVAAGGDGTGTPVGHLFTTVDLTVGGMIPAGSDTAASLQWRGEIVEAKLPAGHGVDAGAKTSLAGRFYYV